MPGPLSDFLRTLSSAADTESAARLGTAHAAKSLDAEVAALVRGSRVVARFEQSVRGLADAAVVAAARAEPDHLELPGLGLAALAISPIDAGSQARLVVARRDPAHFTVEEKELLADMARALALRDGVYSRAEHTGSDRPLHLGASDRGAEQALCNSAHRLRQILQTTRDAFIALDAEGLIVDWNDEAETTFGWPRSQALGRRFADTIIAAEARDEFSSNLEAFLAQADRAGNSHRIELEALHREGRELPVELGLSRLRAGGSYILQVFARDMTESVQAERDRREAEERLAHQALHDSLTGLPNRVLLFDRLGHALVGAKRRGSSMALLFVDLDNFRLVNESLGHRAGDELLVQVAQLLARIIRDSDTMARMGDDTVVRFGGDEFVIACEDVFSERDAIAIAGRIASALADPFLVAGEQVFATASIGIGMGAGEATPDSVIREAEAAMYRAKERGRARYELFDPAMGERVFNRLHEESELRRAIAREELRLFYQPIISVVDGGLVGAEALVRWEHPERGLLEPEEFLPLAEETGMIIPLGRWVLSEACTQAKRWQADRPDGLFLRVAVNISGCQLARGDLPASVADLLVQSGLDPSRLTLEVTESVLMEEGDGPAEVLRELRALGVQVSLDDFGTGYSSLSYLRRLPFDAVKLDRSFIAGLGEGGAEHQIVAAVVQMARALLMTVVAEGVETAEQWSCLRELGCHLAQGYHFARAMPAAQMTSLVNQASARGGLLVPDRFAPAQA